MEAIYINASASIYILSLCCEAFCTFFLKTEFRNLAKICTYSNVKFCLRIQFLLPILSLLMHKISKRKYLYEDEIAELMNCFSEPDNGKKRKQKKQNYY